MNTLKPRLNDESLDDLYKPILGDLHKVEQVIETQLRSRHVFLSELTRRVQVYQGKRIRPALLLLCGQASGRITPSHHTLAAAIEMIHVATLVHDDVLDDADVRRHVATVNAEWGNEASVLLGDYLFSQAYSLAATLEASLACQIIGAATSRTCEGELRQISRRGAFDLTESEYFEIVAGKTAELISCACRLGAQFAGASDSVVEAMASYGRSLGLAFQIADDLLDLTGHPSRTGKTGGADWAQRKVTLPLIRFRDRAKPKDVESMRALFDSDVDRRTEAMAILNASNALESSRQTASFLASQAQQELDRLPASDSRDILQRMARFVADREH